MIKVQVLKPGLFTTIQDIGRTGWAYYAIPKSGAIDAQSFHLSNFLVGNPENAPVLEVNIIPPKLLFHTKGTLAITGDNFNFTINNSTIKINETIEVNEGDILLGSASYKSHRCYISFRGQIKTQLHYNSSATYAQAQLGGINGTQLKAGDTIYIIPKPLNQSIKRKISLPSKETTNIIAIHKGPEFRFLCEEMQEKLLNNYFTIDPQSNRMGLRLFTKKPITTTHNLNHSVPVLPGFVQLPPSGLPVILLNDCQTIGGYPRIAFLTLEAMKTIGNIKPGKQVKFDLVH